MASIAGLLLCALLREDSMKSGDAMNAASRSTRSHFLYLCKGGI
jgi:hypothetical protein